MHTLYIDLINYHDKNYAIQELINNINPTIKLANFSMENIYKYNYFFYCLMGYTPQLYAAISFNDPVVKILHGISNKIGRTRVTKFIKLINNNTK